MIIRYKDYKGEIRDLMVNAEEVDYWVDTQKMQVMLVFNGRTHVVFKSKVKDNLEHALDIIHTIVAEEPYGFLDTTNLGN